MGEKIVVGPVNKGLRNDRTAFVIDNDAFPNLINAYQWRGRLKRKRGTSLLNRLKRFFNSISISYNSGSTTITLDGGGHGNLLTGFSLQTNGNIVPGSVTLVASGGPTTYTDPTKDGFLTPIGTGGPNTINYATGAILIPAQAGNTVTAMFNYNPDLPVMGLEDFVMSNNAFPGTIAFDTVYSYNILTAENGITGLYDLYDVSFYKNPSADPANLPGYVPKTNETPTSWNGQDYQQFWTVNYQGALWATNGITIPFSPTNVGMQYKFITNVSNIVAGPPATVQLTIVAHGLVKGDFLFINELSSAVITGINFQTGYVINVIDANNVSVEFPNATLGGPGGATISGIAQYLTNRSDITKDCLRFYDGDPTDGNPDTPTLNGNKGWVNFAPPLSQSVYNIADLPAAQYYLVGARMIFPFKDRLLFLGPVIQSSALGSQMYLQDTVIYSQNGTAYYTASYTNVPNAAIDTPVSANTVFHPILVPANQIATSPAYFEDQTGFGGFIEAGVDSPIVTVSTNEDALIVGFENNLQTRLIYTGNDIVPFNFFVINAELGSNSTFSIINMDEGVITRGSRGFIITGQTQAKRIDLGIPDEVFQIDLANNGSERFCAQRDFINEWIYFTYPVNTINYKFPNQTLQYNYRDDSWAIFHECYTTYGAFKSQSGFIWITVGTIFPTWSDWNEPWNAGSSTLLQPYVIAGNQQGFIVFRDQGTGESKSLYIQSIVNNVVTSPNHCLNEGDYIIITDALGSVGQEVNGKIFSVSTPDTNTFSLNPEISSGLTYSGSGLITRLYVPFIQSKQFPVSWEISRKTRLGPQQYLLSTTANSQITLLIFLSQNAASAYNEGPIIPSSNVVNSSLVYSTILYTCPESTNLGLTPSNINLNMVTAAQQDQIWHRINTSLLGDTVQVGFTMSDEQMRALTPIGNAFTITGATRANPCVLTCNNTLEADQLVQINNVLGMTQLNFSISENNYYRIISANSTSITIEVDSTGFTAYDSGGTVIHVAALNPTAEIEIHAFILDVTPSMVLA